METIKVEIDEIKATGENMYKIEGYEDWCSDEELKERLNKIRIK